jgi:dTDP-glucose 4,6-dehydratase
MKTILVTGGAGFIGTNFIYYMQETNPDIEIVCIDKLTYAGNLSNLDQAMKQLNFHFYHGDICDPMFLEKVFQMYHFDAIVNFAAESHVDRSIESPDAFMQSNYMGVFHLLEAVKKFKSGRFHQVSTDEVYGDTPLDRPDLKFDEQSPLKPSSPYSASKAAADLLVLAYHRTFGLDVTISRCSNNYGPYQYPEKLIPVVISKALKDEKIPVYGNGLNVRDWIHVYDHCTAIRHIVLNGCNGQVYNVGANEELANIQLIQMILSILNKSNNLIEFVLDRAGHDLRYAIDNSKLTSLGWINQKRLGEYIESLAIYNKEINNVI